MANRKCGCPTARCASLTSETLADQAYEALREAIISGELAPREKITERGLADRLVGQPDAGPRGAAPPRAGPARRAAGPAPGAGRRPRRRRPPPRSASPRARCGRVAARLAATNATDAQLAALERLLDEGDAELARLQAPAADRPTLHVDDLAPLLDITRRFHARAERGVQQPGAPADAEPGRRLQPGASARAARRGAAARPGDRAALERYHEHRVVFDAVRGRRRRAAPSG